MKRFDSINVIPFIDIMLVLLAIVLATASFISQGKIEVAIPQSSSKATIKAKDLIELITINKDGQYYYKEKPISLKDLDLLLTTLSARNRITIKVDAKSNFQYFVSISDLLRKHELTKVTVVTTQIKQPAKPQSALSQ